MTAVAPLGGTALMDFPHLPALAMDGAGSDPGHDGEARYRALFNAIDQGFCVVEVLVDLDNRPVDYRFLEVNAAFAEQTGLSDAVGRTMLSLRPRHEPYWFEIYGRVALTGEPVRFEREAAALGRWYEVYAFRIDAPALRHVAILFKDITEQKHGEDRARLLAAEVEHRAKNMLTVVASLVRLTGAETVEGFRRDLLGRIQALATSQRILAEENWQGAELARLVADEMAPYRTGSRVACSGPATTLPAESVQPIAMALHELATNAAKYGALSSPAGRVAIEWSRRAGGDLVLCWRESGGPPVAAAPAHQGIGTTVVMMGIRDQLGGKVEFRWRAEGLVCEMIVPIKA